MIASKSSLVSVSKLSVSVSGQPCFLSMLKGTWRGPVKEQVKYGFLIAGNLVASYCIAAISLSGIALVQEASSSSQTAIGGLLITLNIVVMAGRVRVWLLDFSSDGLIQRRGRAQCWQSRASLVTWAARPSRQTPHSVHSTAVND